MAEQNQNEIERRIKEAVERQGITVEEFTRRAKEVIKRLNRNMGKKDPLMFEQRKILKEIRDNGLYKYHEYDSGEYLIKIELGLTIEMAERLIRRAQEADKRLSDIAIKITRLTLEESEIFKEIKDNELYLCFGYDTFRYCVENEFGITEEEVLEIIRLSEECSNLIFDAISKISPEIVDISFKIFTRHTDNLLKKLGEINGKEKEK